MIPEGLYLLTPFALALGTMRLAKRHVLLHDMKSIEALARVDVLCVDKTGTITEAGMEVAKIVPAKDAENTFLQSLLRDYASAVPDNNATMEAIRDYLERKGKDKDRTDTGKASDHQVCKIGFYQTCKKSDTSLVDAYGKHGKCSADT